MRHGIVGEYYLDITHFCLFTRLKQCYWQKRINAPPFTSCFKGNVFVILFYITDLKGCFRLKVPDYFLFFLPGNFPLPIHGITFVPPPSCHLTHAPCDCWAGECERHCVGNRCAVLSAAHSPATVSGCVEKRGFRHTDYGRLQTMTGTISTNHNSVHSVGWEVFHGIFKNIIAPGLDFSSMVAPRMSYTKCWAVVPGFLS